MKSLIAMIAIAVGVVVSCTASPENASIEFTGGEGPVVRGRSVRIDRAAVSPGVSTLVIEFIGGPSGDIMTNPCHTDYELDVSQATSPMSVTVWERRPSVPPKQVGSSDIAAVCTAEGHFWTLDYALTGPAPSEIIDGSTDETLAVIVVTNQLAAGALPVGWGLKESDAPPEPNATTTRLTDGTSTVFIRATSHADPEAELVTIRTGPEFTEVVIRGDTRAETSVFEGRPQLRFVDGSYLYQLSADQEVSPGVLRAIAEGLE